MHIFRSLSVRVAAVSVLCCTQAQAKDLCTALADVASGRILTQSGVCDQRVTPASTFKLAISLMGYDSGYLVDEHLPALPYYSGYPAWNPVWKTTVDPTTWIRDSVVWYSQRVTEWLGEQRFQQYVTELNYGNADVSGDPGRHNGLTQAWLGSSLAISPLEQLDFIEGLIRRRWPLRAQAYEMTTRISIVGQSIDGWVIHGKTGTEYPHRADGSEDSAHAWGWFVGWASKDGRSLAFVRLIQDEQAQSPGAGLRARDAMMKELPAMLAGR